MALSWVSQDFIRYAVEIALNTDYNNTLKDFCIMEEENEEEPDSEQAAQDIKEELVQYFEL